MPIRQNKPFNPCPEGLVLCNPMDGNDKSCCPPKDPRRIKQEENINTGPPKARSNLPTNLPRFTSKPRPTKNINRDIVVSGNKPIPKITYAKDGTKRFGVTEEKKYNNRVHNVIPHGNNGGGQSRQPTPCCTNTPGRWSCSSLGTYTHDCIAMTDHPGGHICELGYDPDNDWGNIRGKSGECCCGGHDSYGAPPELMHLCNDYEAVLDLCGGTPWWWGGSNCGGGESQETCNDAWDPIVDGCHTNPDGYNTFTCWDGSCAHAIYETNFQGESYFVSSNCPPEPGFPGVWDTPGDRE
jgi:hypothetical protein|tara:strand:- start:471 stop:1358 length:888 start_codon:yes stop_codon:yes gene_type:complete